MVGSILLYPDMERPSLYFLKFFCSVLFDTTSRTVGRLNEFGAVFEVKLVDQLIILRREQIQNITQGLAHHFLNCLIFRCVVIINKFMEPLV